MTIKNLFVIIIKLTGLFFIIETFTMFIPEQLNLLINFDTIFPEELRSQNILSFPYITLVLIFIILLLIYYIFIYKTEIIIRFLRIEKYFGDTKIENLTIPIQKYTQISIIIISIILFIFQFPVFINVITKYFGVIESFREGIFPELISSTITIMLSFVGIIFSDKFSKFFTK
ncbi:hypothetical protein HX001_09780 [Empedobacter brevis]|uniref:Uncharacterized protein n=1 Tax=Empedobacter brevis TaxID=247 RepID=A0AAJ1QEX0_9FLAO|nr:hypothetical protein [Empedobacter brevis]MDM1072781.1 hypothetical protein [Empedobacter brevis]QES92799.1 hypothetical protein F0358_08755 [Empedobacter brevis]